MRFALLLMLVLFHPSPIAAQAPTIPPGTRVRVETQQKTKVTGTLMSQTSDSIIVAAPNAIRTVVASEDVRRIVVSNGRSHVNGALRGMAIGSTVVGGGTALLMAAAGAGASSIVPFLAYTAAGAGVGAVYGAAIGVLFSRERWSTVYSTPSRVAVAPFHGGAPGLGVVIRF